MTEMGIARSTYRPHEEETTMSDYTVEDALSEAAVEIENLDGPDNPVARRVRTLLSTISTEPTPEKEQKSCVSNS